MTGNSRPGKTSVTNGTMVWSLVTVGSKMSCQMLRSTEFLIAQLAFGYGSSASYGSRRHGPAVHTIIMFVERITDIIACSTLITTNVGLGIPIAIVCSDSSGSQPTNSYYSKQSAGSTPNTLSLVESSATQASVSIRYDFMIII